MTQQKKKSKRHENIYLVYAVFILFSLIITSVTSVYFVVPKVDTEVTSLQLKTLQNKGQLAASHIKNFIYDRVQALKDVARRPYLVNAVMGSSSDLGMANDYLNDIRVLGEKTPLYIINILGDVILNNQDQINLTTLNDERLDYLLDGNQSIFFNINQENNNIEVTIPITYNGYVEGALKGTISLNLKEYFKEILSENQSIFVLKDQHSELATHQNLNYYKSRNNFEILPLKLEKYKLTLYHIYDLNLINDTKDNILSSLVTSIIIGLLSTFTLVFIIGRRILISPYYKLIESENKLSQQAQVIERSHDAIVITSNQDTDFKIQYVNQAFESITGYKSYEVIGKNPRFLQGDKTNPEVKYEIKQCLKNGQSFRGEILNYNKKGIAYWLETIIFPIKDDQKGEILNFAAVQRDVTENHEAKLQLKEAMNLAKHANEAKSQFLANMSHEIRTPMNGIYGSAQLLSDTNLSEEQKEFTHIIQHSSKSLLTIINDILDFSKIESGNMSIEEMPFDLNTVINDVIILLETQAESKGIYLNSTFPQEKLPTLLGDPTRLRQVILNLVSNAVKFTKDGGVTINLSIKSTSHNKATLLINITDTGIGMTKEQCEHIFKPFIQADNSISRRFGGTGLGTAISNQLIKLMGGTIDVFSEFGKGSTFQINLSLNITEDLVLNHDTKSVSSKTFNQRILLVEDNPINRKVAVKTLSKLGLSVKTATDGMDAINKITDDLDLILMDIQMPKMNGIECTKVLREKGISIPIVAMTANVMKEDITNYLNSGFDACIPKPYDTSDITKVLDKLFTL